MKTSELYSMSISDLYNLRREIWDKIKMERKHKATEDELRPLTVDMAYVQKALQEREEDSPS